MKILHLSDYHYKSRTYSKFSENKIISKLCHSLLKHKDTIDLVVFSGDLVNNGEKYEDFENAKSSLLDLVAKTLNISTDQFIICAGNHDIDRVHRLESLEDYFTNKITDNSSLNNFVNAKGKDYINSILGIENFNKFIKNYYGNSIYSNDLLKVYKKQINNAKIGSVVINSAWRTMGDKSFGFLLFPITLIEEALELIKDCNCKLIVVHHPLFWFNEFNQRELQELIHKEFNIIFSGHIHSSEVSAHYKYNNGILAHTASASMTYDKDCIGYAIVQCDPKNNDKVEIINSKYINDFNDFIDDKLITVDIPCGEEKSYQNSIRNKINSKHDIELSNANDLLLNNEIDENNEDQFIKQFNNPVLKTTSKEISVEKSGFFNFIEILNNSQNYLLFGHDKSGKSSILKYIQLWHLKRYSNNGNIPFYLDFKELDSKIDSNWSLIKLMKIYFELSLAKTKTLIENHRFRLLIDNYDPNHPLAKIINNFLDTFPKVNFIICSDYLISRITENFEINKKEYKKLYIHDITRKDVRVFSEKVLDSNIERKDEILEKLVSWCKQLEMPLNYWTISILLLIHKKSMFDLSKNLYEILDLCVDEILNKKFLTLTKSKVTFKQLKSIGSKLAHFLLTKDGNQKYSAKYSSVLSFLETTVSSNVRLRANPREILDYLMDVGVLKITNEEYISFRLNGIFEYFIAYNMSQDISFRDKIINDNNAYLSFKNEFEIYSGLNSGEEQFLKTIFEKTKTFFKPINDSYKAIGDADNILKSKLSSKNTLMMDHIVTAIKLNEPLKEDKKDIIQDQFDPVNINGDIVPKRIYDISKMNSEIFERYISILARVYKTMDDINDPKILNEIFDFILDTYINFGFFILDEVGKEIKLKESINENIVTETNILELLNKFIPIFTQVTFSDGIAHYNVEEIILNKIEELTKNYKVNQYRLFLLYFILMDLDEKNIKKYTDELIKLTELGALKYSIVIKLNYYFSFNGHRSKDTAMFLKDRIEKLQSSINHKTDMPKLQKNLEKGLKKNLLKE
ncbi:MAG: metallophosphoesterase [Marinifilaceae bacterium]